MNTPPKPPGPMETETSDFDNTAKWKTPGPLEAQKALLDESKIRIACAETLGWNRVRWANYPNGRILVGVNPKMLVHEEELPDFLHDANAALLLVAKAKEDGFIMKLQRQAQWECWFIRDWAAHVVSADTFCAAVYEAWLRLCGKWEEVSQ